MAPALISGFWGRWGATISRRMMELKGSAVGSTPTREKTLSSPNSVKASPKETTLEMDCMVKGVSASPAAQRSPCMETCATPNSSGLCLPNSGM